MPSKTWKPLTILLVLAMVMSAVATFSPIVAAGDASVIGTVYDNDNPTEEISGVKVMYAGDSGVFINVTTDSNGKFLVPLAGHPKENFNLTFKSEQYYERGPIAYSVTLYGTGEEANTNKTYLVPLPKVWGKVVDTGGSPLSGVDVTIDGETQTTGTDGKFQKFVADGTYDIYYQKYGYYSFKNESVEVSDSKNIGNIVLERVVPTPTIEVLGIVYDGVSGDKLAGVEAMISSGDDKWISAMTNANGKYSMMAYSGTFQVMAQEEMYETFISNPWLEVPSDAEHVPYDIHLTPVPLEIYEVDLVIEDIGTSNPIEGADVFLHRNDGKYTKHAETDAAGWTNFTYSDNLTVGSDFFIVEVDHPNYFTYIFTNNITAADDGSNFTLQLTPIGTNITLDGYVWDKEGGGTIAGASIKLYDRDHTHMMQTSSDEEGYYSFSVHWNGNFTMVINADGFQSEAYSVLNVIKHTDKRIELIPSPKDTRKIAFTFTTWQNITVNEEIHMAVDNVSTRADIDTKYGTGPLGLNNSNWVVSAGEVAEWSEYLKGKGIEQSDTSDILTLNDRFYELDTASFIITITNADQSVIAGNSVININKVYEYNMIGDFDFDPNEIVLNASYDGDYVDYMYEIYLPMTPTKYEMTDNTTETTEVIVSGYNNPIYVDTGTGTGTETVTLMFGESLGGEAVADITDGLFYEMLNETNAVVGYIVSAPQSGVNTSFLLSAKGSTDPVGDIDDANFTWDFQDDGAADAYGVEVLHNYSVGGAMTVNLTVNETGGNITYHEITVNVDGLAPHASISLNDSHDNVMANDTTIVVDEDLELEFNGSDSYDDLIAANDKAGIIDNWFWVWGDKTANSTVTDDEDNSINHTYEIPGTYTLSMTVTDKMGHESTAATRTVIVNDITAPTVTDFKMFNASMGEVAEAIEGKVLWLGANDTTDNHDDFGNISFTWIIEHMGNKTMKYGDWTNYTFAKIGDYNVTLSAVDTSGNVKNFTKVVNVRVGDRPDLRIEVTSFSFDVDEGTVGQEIMITVNFTNIGSVAATGVTVDFYVRNSDGNDTLLEGTLTLLDSSGTAITDGVIDAGEKFTAQFVWTPSKKGTYTLWANGSTPDEHSSQYSNNNNIGEFEFSTITVKEAGWVIYAIIGGGILILILLYVGIKYFMGMRAGGEIGRGDKRKKK